ncbi:MAG TPA: UDP-N-acetylmuramoyl-L-alanine--D-glutamate ligase [Bryobacteraceae bacterium]|nr:UDP-N-acetylmuramoyl-L-alanine--D-glutamate ligase [Bryobacteraceae bacterium]
MTGYTNTKALIVGGGKSGLAAARYLAARGAAVTISDSKPAAVPGFPVIGQAETDSDGFDLLIQSPGVPLELPLFERARARGARIIGELELAAAELRGRITAITGANGKTTTTALIGHIFRHAGRPTLVGGNIGVPVTDLVADSTPESEIVLELSSFQLETIDTFRAHISLVLNITPDHLDRHGTMKRYVDAKARLVETQTVEGVAVLNAAEPNASALAQRTQASVVWFNLDAPRAGHVASANGFLWLGETVWMPEAEIPLPGRHNVENVMAAAAAAWLSGIPPTVIADAVRSFPGVEHRIEFVRELNGVKYYNDSKATNVDAAEKAIDAFPGSLWIILGGKDKYSDYRPLAARLAAKAKGILLIGAAAPIIRQHFLEADPSLPLMDCDTLEKAIRTARPLAAPGDIVLLSPACASFDQFQSYEHRGRWFKEIVNSL